MSSVSFNRKTNHSIKVFYDDLDEDNKEKTSYFCISELPEDWYLNESVNSGIGRIIVENIEKIEQQNLEKKNDILFNSNFTIPFTNLDSKAQLTLQDILSSSSEDDNSELVEFVKNIGRSISNIFSKT